MKFDPRGFFVINVDKENSKIKVEHFFNVKRDELNTVSTGRFNKIFEGTDAEEMCKRIIEEELVSDLTHAAYLGRELKKAEFALKNNEEYMQQ